MALPGPQRVDAQPFQPPPRAPRATRAQKKAMLYRLHNACPVKWTAVQERSISREFPTIPAETGAERVLRTYSQFLWLPQSIAPLKQLPPALLAAAATSALQPNDGPSSSSPAAQTKQLHSLLNTLLQTPRSVSQKYRTRIPRLLVEEGAEGEITAEDELMWYALKYDKGDAEDEVAEDDEAEERWRRKVLDRMEQREVMMQILVHLVLLSQPLPEDPEATTGERRRSASMSPSKKRKRDSTGKSPSILSVDKLEEHLEMLMDKLAMWQLMGSLDDLDGPSQQATSSTQRSGKGKDKESDDRDWMQIFCEDVVEALFRATLPSHCALLRNKVFPSSPFSDDSDALDLASPPASPRAKPVRTASATAQRAPQKQKQAQPAPDAAARTRSLSVSLEAERERERSRSLSIGPGMQRRALAREVSMSTVFKAKPRAPPRTASRAATTTTTSGASSSATGSAAAAAHVRGRGTTLVAATPVKPKARPPRAAGPAQGALRGRLRALPVEGGADDAEWTIRSSPDVLLIEDDEDDDGAVWAAATPTKKRRA